MHGESLLFLDYNSTTPMHPTVLEAMQPFWRIAYGNAASRHTLGQQAWRAVEKAREQVARLVGAAPADVVFTSGATESNYLALVGRMEYLVEQGRAPASIRAAVSAIEHPCVIACARELQRRGAEVDVIPVTREGVVDLHFFDTGNRWDIVSVMQANHETGAIQPMEQIRERLAASPEPFVHTDAAQWAGRTEGNLRRWQCDAVSLSGHKMYGPKGIGALVLRNGVSLRPIFAGTQEGGLRAGTVFVAGAVGMGRAAECVLTERVAEAGRQSRLRERLWNALCEGGCRAIRTLSPDRTLPNTLHVRFPGLKGERVVDALDRLGICCSSGPACASGASGPSVVLQAMGYSESEAWEGVRFSLGRETTDEEIREASRRIVEWRQRNAQWVA